MCADIHTQADELAVAAESAIRAIAERHLRLVTLETRNSDDRDFHECAVCALREALLAAYAAGASAATAHRED